MATSNTIRIKPDLRLAAICGLFCPSCRFLIGAHEEPDRLEALAAQFNKSVEELKCDGCRAERRLFYCRNCKMAACAEEKGLEFCHECDEYPCDHLKKFQAAAPHRLELWDNLARIGEAGFEAWFNEMLDHYTCPECGTINSAYDISCRQCGADPASEYLKRHREEIERYFRERK